MKYDYEARFSLTACLESVEFEVETLHRNIFEENGRALVRAKQDPFFNKTMIKAYEQYIADHNIQWDNQ